MDQSTFDKVVELFESARDANSEPLNMHYLLVKQDGQEFFHRFAGRQDPSDIRSLSKTVMSLVCGIVAETHEGFGLDTPVWPILQSISDLTNTANQQYLDKLRIRHLLNHTIGFDKVLLMRDDIADLDPFTYVDHIINAPIVHEPGEYYLYSNAGFYLLGALLQEYLGRDLLGYTDEVLFSPLGITEFRWEKYGNYLAAATRLWLYPHDLLKIGELLLNDGQGIVPKQWIEQLKQPTTLTPGVDTPSNQYFRRYAYASGLWLGAEHGIYFGHGTDGQTLAIVPEKNAVVVTTAHQVDVVRLEELVNMIIDAMYSEG